jgi:hypothetical protein
MKKLLITALLLLPTTALARYSATIEWTGPDQYEDGTPLAPEEILSYEILYGTTSGNYTNSVTVSGTAREYTITNLASGTWYFVATVTTVELETSVISNEVSRKFSRGKPKRAVIRFK